jgi:hypothetical protein
MIVCDLISAAMALFWLKPLAARIAPSTTQISPRHGTLGESAATHRE